MHEVVIFRNQDDPLADLLFRHLQKIGHSVLMIEAEQLAFAHWNHAIDSVGNSKTLIILPGGIILRSEKVKAAFNRIRFLPMRHFVKETDRNYAEAEMFALYVSFLKSINHVLINPVQTSSLFMEEDNELLINKQAIDAGLPVVEYHFTTSPRWRSSRSLTAFETKQSSSDRSSPHLVLQNKPVLFREQAQPIHKLVFVDGKIFGEPFEYAGAVARFAELTGTPFFELFFTRTAHGLKLRSIDKFPLYADNSVIESLASMIDGKISRSQ